MYVCRSRSGTDWKKGTGRDGEEKEGGWGDGGVQSVRQIDGAQRGLTLQVAIILLAFLHTLSDSIMVRPALQKLSVTKVWNRSGS